MPTRFSAFVLMCFAFAACVFPAAAADTLNATTLYRNYAAYLQGTGKPKTALLALQSRSITTGPLAAQLYIKAGLLQPAANALRKWPDKKSTMPVWLALAQAQYRAEKWSDAEHSLAQTPTFLPAESDQQKASLLARSLLHQNRNDEAARVLDAAVNRLSLGGVDKYNLGVAWLRAGEDARGAGVLSELGRDKNSDAYTQALADQANLVLGYWFLRHQRGGLARAAFERIRMHGPLADNAKVGIGWAELATGGGVQRLGTTNRGPCGAPQPGHWGQTGGLSTAPPRPCNNRQAEFNDEVLAGKPGRATPQQAMRRAAVAWDSATTASNLSPVVQEALISLPFALAQAGEAARARTAYGNAIARLEPYIARRAAQIAELTAGTIGAGDNAFTRASDWSLQAHEVTRINKLRRHMAQLSAGVQRDVIAASGLAPSNTDTGTLAVVLTQLRKRAPPGRKYAVPNAVQRGVLILAVNANHAPAVGSDRKTSLINGLHKLAQRIEDLKVRLATARRQRELKIINASYAFSQARLREAYEGLADLGK